MNNMIYDQHQLKPLHQNYNLALWVACLMSIIMLWSCAAPTQQSDETNVVGDQTPPTVEVAHPVERKYDSELNITGSLE